MEIKQQNLNIFSSNKIFFGIIKLTPFQTLKIILMSGVIRYSHKALFQKKKEKNCHVFCMNGSSIPLDMFNFNKQQVGIVMKNCISIALTSSDRALLYTLVWFLIHRVHLLSFHFWFAISFLFDILSHRTGHYHSYVFKFICLFYFFDFFLFGFRCFVWRISLSSV